MTPKIEEEVYRGIHYIQITNLPVEQKERFHEWLPADQVIKIMIGKKILADCVQYHHYENWYDNILPGSDIEASENQDKIPRRENRTEGQPHSRSDPAPKSTTSRLSFLRLFSLKPSS